MMTQFLCGRKLRDNEAECIFAQLVQKYKFKQFLEATFTELS